MVFGVQKVGFCIAKVWFLFFKRVFFVLQYTIPCPRNTPQNGVALVLFGNIIFTYFWVLPTFLYLTNFAFAK